MSRKICTDKRERETLRSTLQLRCPEGLDVLIRLRQHAKAVDRLTGCQRPGTITSDAALQHSTALDRRPSLGSRSLDHALA